MGRKLLKAFEDELKKIKNDDLRNITKELLTECSDKTATAPTSSTGKYHPEWSLGEGGLVRHSKAVCVVAETFMKQMPAYDGEDWDVPYIAAMLHDCCKYTYPGQKWVHYEHPLLMAEKIRERAKNENEEISKKLNRIADCVASHMSRWDTNPKTGEKCGTTPETIEQWIVAMADMLVAQKWITIDGIG